MAVGFKSLNTLSAEDEGLAFVQSVVRLEAEALDLVRNRLDGTIVKAAERIYQCDGNVIVTGIGKAGLVGHKLAATLASTGTRAITLHPADAVHGDLGRIRSGDVVLALSQSGETDEVLRLIPSFRRLDAYVVAVTGLTESSLGRSADLCIALGLFEEACPLGLPDAWLSLRGFRFVPPGGEPGTNNRKSKRSTRGESSIGITRPSHISAIA